MNVCQDNFPGENRADWIDMLKLKNRKLSLKTNVQSNNEKEVV